MVEDRSSTKKRGQLFSLIEGFALFLNLVTYFELGNLTMLKYAVDSYGRFLKKKRNGIRSSVCSYDSFRALVWLKPLGAVWMI